MVEGSCLCGGVAYRAGGPFEAMARCYCNECRKASGAECATNVTVEEDHVEWLRGRELLSSYESSPGNVRSFCSNCGSPVMKKTESIPGKLRLRTGLFDGDHGSRIQLHVFVGERAAWTEILDDLPQFERVPVPKESDA